MNYPQKCSEPISNSEALTYLLTVLIVFQEVVLTSQYLLSALA